MKGVFVKNTEAPLSLVLYVGDKINKNAKNIFVRFGRQKCAMLHPQT